MKYKPSVRTIIGLMVALVGSCASIYFGVWIMFVGGIVDIVNELNATVMDGNVIAVSILKIMSATFITSVLCASSWLIGIRIAIGRGILA